MSLEEDTELRDLLTQTLETNGSLAKIRAQLRASVFLALDEDELIQKRRPLFNAKIKSHLETTEGKVMFCLVREFLEFFDLDFTMSVYEPESYMGSEYQYEGRCTIIENLGLPLEETSAIPLLLQLIQMAKCNKGDASELRMNDLEKSDNLKPDERVLMNQTFDIHSPNVCIQENKTNVVGLKTEDSLKSGEASTEKATDSVSFDLDRSDKSEDATENEKSLSLLDPKLLDCDFSPPVVKDSKHAVSFEKLKSPSQKTDKLKAKNNLSSLADLPPLQISKPRNDMLLPSLYTKEFKDKNNLRDIEKIFDLESLDNYEEDFMSESEIDMLVNKSDVKSHSPENSCAKGSVNGEDVSWRESKVESLSASPKFDPFATPKRERNNSSVSSVTSEDFITNTTVDEI